MAQNQSYNSHNAFGSITTGSPFGGSWQSQSGPSTEQKCMTIITLTFTGILGNEQATLDQNGVDVRGYVTGTKKCACKKPPRTITGTPGDELSGKMKTGCSDGQLDPTEFTIWLPASNGHCAPDKDCEGQEPIPKTRISSMIPPDRLGESTTDGDGPLSGDVTLDGCLKKPNPGLNSWQEYHCMLLRGIDSGATGKTCGSASRNIKNAGVFVALKDFAMAQGPMRCGDGKVDSMDSGV